MILVVISMLSMLAMVALAIDVIALYAARSEAQRAADGAALAAAKMLGWSARRYRRSCQRHPPNYRADGR